jgi:hypothetical protein
MDIFNIDSGIYNKYDNDRNENDTKFITNFKKLYKYGKIVVYDNDFETLLSHAGGMDKFIFHNATYYDNIIINEINKIEDKIKDKISYFDKIENCRKGLMKQPSESYKLISNIGNVENAINLPLSKAFEIKEDKSIEIKIKDEKWFCLLQALGLKPDVNQPFISFVASCDVQSCTGPKIGPDDDEYKKFITKLSILKVKTVSAGHAPHCVNAPIIYKRTGTKDTNVIIIANDTSNGGRPATIIDVADIPISYITKKKDESYIYSVGSLTKEGILSLYKLKQNANKILNYPDETGKTGETNDFTDLIRDWTVDNAYTVKQIDGHMSIVDDKKIILNFTTKENLYGRAKTETQLENPGVGGGKKRKGRVTKKQRKNKKNYKHTCKHH